ncbi:MAG: DNA-directed RNA polymerase sigma-70 factor [Herpetosiphonaceae bacterium]|nr:MAG: DNA-directed RNA polymerase sigma-70 factor [Herpetosiphonaceae bacterium]
MLKLKQTYHRNDDEPEETWEELEALVEEAEELAAEKGTEPVEDSVQMYLREIGQVPLLTAQEEVTLAKQIEAGKIADERLEKQDYHTDYERKDLERAVLQGHEARRHLIQANLRLVVSVAKKYMGHQLSFMDLVQEGNIGLMRAVEKFDYRKGNRFSTYATWWIRQAVTRSLAEHGRLIRLPVHLSEGIMQLRRVTYQLEQALQREPTPEEIAEALGISVRKVKRMLNAATQPVSLERPIGPDGEGKVGEFLADDRIEGPLDVATQHMLHKELAEALEKLPERERTVLQLRYGLHDGKRRTLEEVGAAFGITRERTRQIEAEAMRHLRAPEIGQHLRAYLDS